MKNIFKIFIEKDAFMNGFKLGIILGSIATLLGLFYVMGKK